MELLPVDVLYWQLMNAVLYAQCGASALTGAVQRSAPWACCSVPATTCTKKVLSRRPPPAHSLTTTLPRWSLPPALCRMPLPVPFPPELHCPWPHPVSRQQVLPCQDPVSQSHL
ncbi:hypothetical protein KIL84_022863 [Mauremys mutica]|uniref:Uncharacterized protein n=1 Tax=Mauremys mutica TaxID=74926 RepID=A0A9D3WP21_9SAUR|nr:hypothetical protein KIL84_022863 [Mauremys mutica]